MYSTGHIDKKEVDQPKPMTEHRGDEWEHREHDQPKPTTGCTCNKENRGAAQHSSICLAANTPKPTTGERDYLDPNRVDKVYPKTATGEWTAQTVDDLARYDGYKGVADAHTAALAAEREKHEKTVADVVEQVRLSTEPMLLELQQRREQLDFQDKVIKQRTEALNLTSEQLKPLVDELTRMSFSYLATADELRQMARDVIAKVKDGK